MKFKNLNKPWWVYPVLILGPVLVYSNTLDAPFYFDDIHNILESASLRMDTLTLENFKRAGFDSLLSNRPISYIAFAINYYIGGTNVFFYHVINISIHILNGLFLYSFLTITFSHIGKPAKIENKDLIAFSAALIWILHPLQTQSVTYIVQRMNSMAALFYMISMWSYVKARLCKAGTQKWLFYTVCLIAGLLSLGSKEIAATLPIFILLYEWFFFQNRQTDWLKRRSFLLSIFAIGIIAVLLYYLGSNPIDIILAEYNRRDFTLIERVLTEHRVVLFYIGLLLYPAPGRLNLLHDFEISHSLLEPPTTLICLSVIVCAIYLALYLSRKEAFISFCVLWFFGNLVIESSFIGLEIIFEHRTYLPSMLFFPLVLIILFRCIKSNVFQSGLVVVVCVILCIWTYERNQTWRDPVGFWNDTVQKSPQSARAYNMLGASYLNRHQYPLAIKSLKQAIDLKPHMAEAYINLATVYMNTGDTEKAISTFEYALKLAPRAHYAYNNLGVLYAAKMEYQEAEDLYLKAIKYRSDHAAAHYNLGSLYLKQNQINKAIKRLRKAIEIDPEFADAHSNLGQALFQKGLFMEGVYNLKKALQINPDHPDAAFNLARAYELMGDYNLAIAQYRYAQQINPQDALAFHNAGLIYLHHVRNPQKAINNFRKALFIDPHYPYAESAKKLIAEVETGKN